MKTSQKVTQFFKHKILFNKKSGFQNPKCLILRNFFSSYRKKCEINCSYKLQRLQKMLLKNWIMRNSPRPLRPTNRKSLNLATWFFIKAVELRSSAQKFSSLPALTVTRVPSPTSPRATTLNAIGNVLLDLQCDGNTVQTTCGHPFQTINSFPQIRTLVQSKYRLLLQITRIDRSNLLDNNKNK